MNETVRSNSKRSCAIVTIVEIISSQSRDNVIGFDDHDVTTRMPDRVHRAYQRNWNEYGLMFALTSALSRCARPQRGKVFQPRSGRAQRDRALVSASLMSPAIRSV
jgi:hypothetical protein